MRKAANAAFAALHPAKTANAGFAAGVSAKPAVNEHVNVPVNEHVHVHVNEHEHEKTPSSSSVHGSSCCLINRLTAGRRCRRRMGEKDRDGRRRPRTGSGLFCWISQGLRASGAALYGGRLRRPGGPRAAVCPVIGENRSGPGGLHIQGPRAADFCGPKDVLLMGQLLWLESMWNPARARG